jgi:hypothetical protein
VDIKNRIKIARDLLNNAIKMNVNPEIIYKISRKIDTYIAVYYHQEYEGAGVYAKEDEQ